MNCPFDGSTLQVVNRPGIEIDRCPDCRGVRLERGELDQLIDRLAPPPAAAPMRSDDSDRWAGSDGDRRSSYDLDDDDSDDDRPRRGGSRRRCGGLLGEIFDF